MAPPSSLPGSPPISVRLFRVKLPDGYTSKKRNACGPTRIKVLLLPIIAICPPITGKAAKALAG